MAAPERFAEMSDSSCNAAPSIHGTKQTKSLGADNVCFRPEILVVVPTRQFLTPSGQSALSAEFDVFILDRSGPSPPAGGSGCGPAAVHRQHGTGDVAAAGAAQEGDQTS